jgi:Family of unknown function (DUF5760)
MNTQDLVVYPVNKKAEFIENIKKWVLLDSQLKMVNEKVKKMREIRQSLLDEIVEYAKENHIDHKKIEISDGELRFYEKKEYQPLSYHFLEENLGKIVKNKDQVDQIIAFLRENREITTYTDIRRIYKENP